MQRGQSSGRGDNFNNKPRGRGDRGRGRGRGGEKRVKEQAFAPTILSKPTSSPTVLQTTSVGSVEKSSIANNAMNQTSSPGEIRVLRPATPAAQLLQHSTAAATVSGLTSPPKILSAPTTEVDEQLLKSTRHIKTQSAPQPAAPQVAKLMTSSLLHTFSTGRESGRHYHHHHHIQQVSYEVCLEQCSKHLSEQSDYVVIGIIGQEGAGKSFVMSSLVQNSQVPVFSQQSAENWIEQKHETNGIDMFVYSGMGSEAAAAASLGVVLLDTQPLFSSSLLNELIVKDAKLDPDVMSFENYIDLLSIQMGLFLFSVCHVVIVLQDSLSDTRMLKLVQTLRMLQKGIPNILSSSTVSMPTLTPMPQQPSAEPAGTTSNTEEEGATSTTTNTTGSNSSGSSTEQSNTESEQHYQTLTSLLSHEYVPELVFVYNKISEEDCTPHDIFKLQKFLDTFFSNTSFNKNGYVHPFRTAQENTSTENHVNFYVLPHFPSELQAGRASGNSVEDVDEINSQNKAAEEDKLNKFRHLIYSMPKIKWSKTISEKDWLQNASRVWDLIQKSHFISEYNRSYQKLQLYKT